MPSFPNKTSKEDVSAMEEHGEASKKTLATRKRQMDTFINYGFNQEETPTDVLELIKKAEQGDIAPLERTLEHFFADFWVGPNDELPKRNTIEAYR